MVRISIICVLIFLLKPGFSQVFEDITALEADSLILENVDNPDFVILDVRRPNEYDPEHLFGAINRNYYDSDFKEQLDSLPKHKTYLLHCKSGGRSAKAHDSMYVWGFEEVYNMLGGINAWKNDGLTVTDSFMADLMIVGDSIYEYKEVPIGDTDTISLTVTNRANALLIFHEICSIDNFEFSTDFDPDTTLRGAFDYSFNIFYDPVDEMADSLSFCVDSEVGKINVLIYRNGIDESSNIEIISERRQIVVFPNPVVDHISFRIKQDVSSDLNISWYDSAGKCIIPNENFQIPSGESILKQTKLPLEPGIYFVKLDSDSEIKVIPVVI